MRNIKEIQIHFGNSYKAKHYKTLFSLYTQAKLVRAILYQKHLNTIGGNNILYYFFLSTQNLSPV